MINTLTISNFKGFKQLNIPALSRITLLGGHNNVGKTSILEALFLFHDRLNPAMFIQQLNFRGLPTVSLDSDSIWAPLFNEFNINKPIKIDLKKEIPEHLTFTFKPDHKRNLSIQAMNKGIIKTESNAESTLALEIKYKKGSNEQISYMIINQDSLNLETEKTPPTKLSKATFLSARMHISPNEDANRFGRLDLLNKIGTIVEFLKEIEPRLKGLSSILIGDISYIHADIGLERKIPVKLMGDGVSRLLSIILAIADSNGGIVLIDEVENGIHYSVMPAIWKGIAKAALEFDCQVVATTHSYECLQSAHEGINDTIATNDFTYIRLDRKDDIITPKSFTNDLLGTALSANMEVR